ncbi:hypothetical protein D5039_02405 [Verminephrobacter aporrectodeae subsp. tuberculatae]|uniref:Uncharacterized protein n=1 Tax=Verminephrobacter aporrectodeae subsp. tuberculatae TaxID=1110392 RepID=A0ABT3KP24_9BURK|nr:hypothetical protein [Verminephrobacter aporrectodeae subsp. tuberculatae]MCW8165809.1 hypothetical protein [Verminephrobacter aporrectodeae subsp. tuberculatae]MCW8169899.1 hypothetical protein [Verminephrobacter aporrectodeae subsp. tuberculatae]MCW8207721.1 hypothetical protein [Verminephrobacter aporrectodeae subsp. tuberculatae]
MSLAAISARTGTVFQPRTGARNTTPSRSTSPGTVTQIPRITLASGSCRIIARTAVPRVAMLSSTAPGLERTATDRLLKGRPRRSSATTDMWPMPMSAPMKTECAGLS